MTVWPCTTCGATGVRNLGTHGHCALHLSDLYRSFHPEVWENIGIGLIDGPDRSDVLAGAVDLACSLCGAQWIGAPFTECPWCITDMNSMIRWQHDLLLEPPDIDIDDTRITERAIAWGERLDRAVTAGIVERYEADRVVQRWLNHATA